MTKQGRKGKLCPSFTPPSFRIAVTPPIIISNIYIAIVRAEGRSSSVPAKQSDSLSPPQPLLSLTSRVTAAAAMTTHVAMLNRCHPCNSSTKESKEIGFGEVEFCS
jgi:hypothetical protein